MSTRLKTFESIFWEVPRIMMTKISDIDMINCSTHFCHSNLTSVSCNFTNSLGLMKTYSMMKMLILITSTVFCCLSVRMTALVNVNSLMMISFCLVLDSTILSSNIQQMTSSRITTVILPKP